MAFDATYLTAVLDEIRAKAMDARVDIHRGPTGEGHSVTHDMGCQSDWPP